MQLSIIWVMCVIVHLNVRAKYMLRIINKKMPSDTICHKNNNSAK